MSVLVKARCHPCVCVCKDVLVFDFSRHFHKCVCAKFSRHQDFSSCLLFCNLVDFFFRPFYQIASKRCCESIIFDFSPWNIFQLFLFVKNSSKFLIFIIFFSYTFYLFFELSKIIKVWEEFIKKKKATHTITFSSFFLLVWLTHFCIFLSHSTSPNVFVRNKIEKKV